MNAIILLNVLKNGIQILNQITVFNFTEKMIHKPSPETIQKEYIKA